MLAEKGLHDVLPVHCAAATSAGPLSRASKLELACHSGLSGKPIFDSLGRICKGDA